jgi:hypothetical protein
MDSVRIIENSHNLYSKLGKLVFIYDDDDDGGGGGGWWWYHQNVSPTYWQNEKVGGEYLKKNSSPTFHIFLTDDYPYGLKHVSILYTDK